MTVSVMPSSGRILEECGSTTGNVVIFIKLSLDFPSWLRVIKECSEFSPFKKKSQTRI
jgi:hypothetical protein